MIYAIEDDLKNKSNYENKHGIANKWRWSSVFASGYNVTLGQFQLQEQSLAILAPQYHSFICTQNFINSLDRIDAAFPNVRNACKILSLSMRLKKDHCQVGNQKQSSVARLTIRGKVMNNGQSGRLH